MSVLDKVPIDPLIASLPKADLHLHQEEVARLERVVARRQRRPPHDWRESARRLGAETPAGEGRLAADRVVASTAAANRPSCQLLRRVGLKEIGQGTGSLGQTPEGEPIEFLSLSFAISRAEWTALGQPSMSRDPGVKDL